MNGRRYRRFDRLGAKTTPRRRGVWKIAWIVMSTPSCLMGNFFEVRLNRDDDFVLKLFLLFTGLAAYTLGGVIATLNHLDGDAGMDPRLYRVPPPPDERGGAS